ncbi:MAG TPA: hypothetical protein VNK43_01155 [Gemmatimonadales bacterium]|nr:hypothetical protein [Gemmatimonadales bacterium]
MPISRLAVCRVVTRMLETLAREPIRPAPVPDSAMATLDALAVEVIRSGFALDDAEGPWHVDQPPDHGPATVARGAFSLVAGDRAGPIAALFNWCGAPEPPSPRR